jgi:hypothetical protein
VKTEKIKERGEQPRTESEKIMDKETGTTTKSGSIAGQKSKPTTTTYKGHVLLVLNPDEDKFRQVSFGLRKAKLIVEYMDELQNFIEEQEAE